MHVNMRFNGRLRLLVVRDLGLTVGSGRAAGKWCAAPASTHGGPPPRLNFSAFVAWGASQLPCIIEMRVLVEGARSANSHTAKVKKVGLRRYGETDAQHCPA